MRYASLFLLGVAAVGCRPPQILESQSPVHGSSAHTSPPVGCESLVESDDSPVQIVLVEEGQGKARWYSVGLQFINHASEPRWFLLPFSLDDPLAEDGIFPIRKWDFESVGAKQYYGKDSAIEVTVYGETAFQAFRLPGGGRLEFETYGMHSMEHVEGVVVFEVAELLVDGCFPLEKWLPYETLSPQRAYISTHVVGRAEWKSLDLLPGTIGRREDYPTQKIKSVTAKGIQRWPVKFQKASKPNVTKTTR